MAVSHRRRFWKNIGVTSIHSVLRSVGFLRRMQAAPPHQLGSLRERCELLQHGLGRIKPSRNWIWCILVKKIWHLVTMQMTDIFTAQTSVYSCNLCVCVSSHINTVLYHVLLTPYILASFVGYFSFLTFWLIFSPRALTFAPTLHLRQKSCQITDSKIVQWITTK